MPTIHKTTIEVDESLVERAGPPTPGLPDLLLAAIAERHRVTLLHYDADFDMVGAITGQPMQWVAPRGSVP
jgi:hypothetical protein